MDFLDLLPHQMPFRFVEHVCDYTPGKMLLAEYDTSHIQKQLGELQHVPSTLLLEGLAQASVIFTQLETQPLDEGEFPLLGSLEATITSDIGFSEIVQYRVSPIRIATKKAILEGIITDSTNTVAIRAVICVAVSREKPREEVGGG